MLRFRFLEELWTNEVSSHLQSNGNEKVNHCVAISLTDMGGYPIYDFLAMELDHMLIALDEMDVIANSSIIPGHAYLYNKLKYSVLAATQKSLTTNVSIDGMLIKNVQVMDTYKDINFIFTVSYLEMFQGYPITLLGILRVIEEVCETHNVADDKHINLYINIGYSFINQRFKNKAEEFVKIKREEFNGTTQETDI
jgi:hypothetical protein